jgi:hypothetical protein
MLRRFIIRQPLDWFCGWFSARSGLPYSCRREAEVKIPTELITDGKRQNCYVMRRYTSCLVLCLITAWHVIPRHCKWRISVCTNQSAHNPCNSSRVLMRLQYTHAHNFFSFVCPYSLHMMRDAWHYLWWKHGHIQTNTLPYSYTGFISATR